jgi:hypothetical protein
MVEDLERFFRRVGIFRFCDEQDSLFPHIVGDLLPSGEAILESLRHEAGKLETYL